MKTKKVIQYHSAPYGLIAEIPAGARITRARNLPQNGRQYWVLPWRGMSESARSWCLSYGFLVSESEVR